MTSLLVFLSAIVCFILGTAIGALLGFMTAHAVSNNEIELPRLGRAKPHEGWETDETLQPVAGEDLEPWDGERTQR